MSNTMTTQITTAAAAILRSITHTEIAHATLAPSELDLLFRAAEGSVDVTEQYGHHDVWGTDGAGREWRVAARPSIA
jgi:hypothetical protein